MRFKQMSKFRAIEDQLPSQSNDSSLSGVPCLILAVKNVVMLDKILQENLDSRKKKVFLSHEVHFVKFHNHARV